MALGQILLPYWCCFDSIHNVDGTHLVLAKFDGEQSGCYHDELDMLGVGRANAHGPGLVGC